MIGDAALHRDPITAQGITNAFTHAQILADELTEAHAGRKTIDAAVADYDARQLDQLKPMFDYTVYLAQLKPFPEPVQQMIGAMLESQPAMNAFIGAFIGSVRLGDVFPDEMVEGFSKTVDSLADAHARASRAA